MIAQKCLQILALSAALGTGVRPALSEPTDGTSDSAAADRAEALMKTLGSLPLPILLDMNCPRNNQAKEDKFITDLSPNVAARTPLKALLAASREVVNRDRARIERGEDKDSNQISSDQQDIKTLSRLTSEVSAALGKNESLNYEKAKLQYRGDTMMDAILSAIANISKYQIPAYNTAVETFNSAAAETIKSAFIDRRLNELNQHAETASNDLTIHVAQEFEIERQEWAALRDVIAVGLDNLSDAPGLQQKTSLRKNDNEHLQEEATRLGGHNPDSGNYKRDFSPLNVVNSLGNSLPSPLQKLEDAQKQLREALTREDSIAKTKSSLVEPIPPPEVPHSGTLKTRGAIVTPGLQAIYESGEFDAAYRAADRKYRESKADPAYAPSSWDAKKPLFWLMHSEQQMWKYSGEFEAFKHLLDAATENAQVRNRADKVAQLSEIQDQLTEDNVDTLNGMIKSVDLRAFLLSNHLPEMAKLWTPARLPERKRVLDESKMVEVVKLLENINTCLTASGKARVQFAHSASFSSNVPRDEDDKPLTPQQALVFWQWHNHGPVDKAVVELYDSLHRAQRAAAEEGLLSDSETTPDEAGSVAKR